jgi:hypothetical protein
MLDTFKRDVRSYTRLALAAYDKLETDLNSLRSRLSLLKDNRQARENPVRLTETFISATASAWEDDIVVSSAIEKLDYTVPMKGYHVYVPYNEINIGRPNMLATLQEVVAKLPLALLRKEVKLIMNVFRLNPLTVDGQNFFDTDHTHINGVAYSNVVPFEVANPALPTFDESKAAISEALTRLASINAIEAEVVDASQFKQDITIICHSAAQMAVFEMVRTQVQRNNVENELKGAFSLLLDRNPASGTETSFEVCYLPAGGPRPAIFVPDVAPWLDTWKDNVRNGYVAVGMKEIFGVKPGHAFTTVRVELEEAS